MLAIFGYWRALHEQDFTHLAKMVRFYSSVAYGLAVLQSLVLALPRSCPDGLCLMTRANLTSAQVQRELGPLLSNSSTIIGPSDPQWVEMTERWQAYKPPRFTVIVEVGVEADIPTVVRILRLIPCSNKTMTHLGV